MTRPIPNQSGAATAGGRRIGAKLRISLVLLALALWVASTTAKSEEAAERLAAAARTRPTFAGAPKQSDVIVRNLAPHPRPGVKTPDPYDTLLMVQELHVTRLEWTYGLTRPFVEKLKALGIAVGGAIEDDSGSASKEGRVLDKDGNFSTHKWFPRDRLVGCVNAAEFRSAWLAEAKRNVDAGVDFMQQDDPQMAVRCSPPLCYCRYCQAAFADYQKEHGVNASYEQFQKDSILAFHLEMHREIDAYAGRHIPFSHNSNVGFQRKLDFTAPAFDFINAEIEGKNISPPEFWERVVAAGDRPMVLAHRETSIGVNRRFLALTYATGTWMMMPWDVFMPDHAPRYFGKAEDYADLSGFVRANAQYLDEYESAAALGKGLADSRWNGKAPAVIEGGSGEVYAFVRVKPGEAGSPVVVHLVDWSESPRPFLLRLDANSFSPKDTVMFRTPKAYDAEAHRLAQESGDFGALSSAAAMAAESRGGMIELSIPALNPWGIVVVQHP